MYDYDRNNIFAKILRDDLPCKKVYETDHALAFWDISPRRKVHLLVISKGPFVNLEHFINDASSQDVAGFWDAVSAVAQQEGLSESGFRVLTNQGPDSGQEVPHFHVHLIGGEPVGPLTCPKEI